MELRSSGFNSVVYGEDTKKALLEAEGRSPPTLDVFVDLGQKAQHSTSYWYRHHRLTTSAAFTCLLEERRVGSHAIQYGYQCNITITPEAPAGT
jgi:hypothetical protein